MSSRSATVLVIFAVACIAFCLASVFAAMTGPISILPNESDNVGILDNLSALTDQEDNDNSYQYYGYDDSDDYSSKSYDDSQSEDTHVETTTDDTHVETTTDDTPTGDDNSHQDDSKAENDNAGDKSTK